MRFQQILQALFASEQTFLPIFIHDPVSQEIAAIAVATEEAIFSIFAMKRTAPVPAAQVTPTPAV